MFINISLLKKFMVNAYKGAGIRIGHKDDGYIIVTSTWGLWLEEENTPNKVKALIMELAGTLPQEDTIFIVSKEKPIPQLEFDFNATFHINQFYRNAASPVTVTNVMLDKKHGIYRLFQINSTKDFMFMNQMYLDLIDLGEMDTNVENTPAGPCTNQSGNIFYWGNAVCTLYLCGYEVTSEDSIVQALGHINFEEEM